MTRFFLFALMLSGCASGPAPKPGPMPPLPPVHIPTMQSCELAEVRLKELDCRREDGSPYSHTRNGMPFAEACKEALADGRPWMSNCILRIPDCSLLMPAYRGEWCGVAK
jgi:hypothetical protein